MKKGVVIVNTARGAVIDEAALVEALDSGHVASCGLDVYEHEPKIHPGLVANPHVMLVPHMGTWTIEVSLVTRVPRIGGRKLPQSSCKATLCRTLQLTESQQTQTAMEEWNISNVRSVLETGALRNVVPEQANLPWNQNGV